MSNIVLGIDVGATGIKGGLVDLEKGILIGERIKIGTPKPSTHAAVSKVIARLIKQFKWDGGAIGCGFPSVIVNGKCMTASNIDKSWIGFNAQKYLSKMTGMPFVLVNDADAAGMAELLYGKAAGIKGTVILLTLGTGVGSALLVDGNLVPNTEFGHLKWRKGVAEDYVSNRARKDQSLSYDDWGKELNKYLMHINHLFSPQRIILGGGVSKRFELYREQLTVDAKVVSAKLFNDAGIIGAAVYAHRKSLQPVIEKQFLN